MSLPTTPLGQSRFSIALPAQMDSAAAHAFHSTLQDVLGRTPRQIHLNCHGVQSIDSTGLSLLTLAKSEAERIGCQISLIDVPRPGTVADVLTLMNFDNLFPITFTETF